METGITTMAETVLYNATNRPSEFEKCQIIEFLCKQLGRCEEIKSNIRKAIEYATKEKSSFGGFVMLQVEHNEILGAAIINQTGMDGYIPENVLVYLVTEENNRGKGIGKKLLELTIRHAKGDIAIHVEKSNPHMKLFEDFGFKNPYLEMRLSR